MSIHKRAETQFWWYSIYRGPGKPRLRGSTGKTDMSEAKAVEQVIRLAYKGKTPASRLHAMIDALSGSERAGLPLSAVWSAYEGWAKSTGLLLSDKTWQLRRNACTRFAAWAAESWPAAACAGDVDRACVAMFASWLSGRGISGKTRRNLIGDLSTVWQGLRRVRDDVTQNPWPLVLPANDGKRGQAFSMEQEMAVLSAADKIGKGWGLACRISRHTGLRYGDVARLSWDAIDFKSGVLRVTPSKTSRHRIAVVIPLCDVLLSALSESRNDAESSFVLPLHAEAWPRPEEGVPGAFSKVLAEAGVTGAFTFHSWRHTFRTRLAEAGVSDEIAKRLGGWTEDATAMRYDHDGRIEELRAAVQRGAAAGGSR
jgi:integrase